MTVSKEYSTGAIEGKSDGVAFYTIALYTIISAIPNEESAQPDFLPSGNVGMPSVFDLHAGRGSAYPGVADHLNLQAKERDGLTRRGAVAEERSAG